MQFPGVGGGSFIPYTVLGFLIHSDSFPGYIGQYEAHLALWCAAVCADYGAGPDLSAFGWLSDIGLCLSSGSVCMTFGYYAAIRLTNVVTM